MKEYDILIIGGGPAGLSAARMSAGLNQKTVLLEKLSKPGELGHPCSGAIGPLPDFVSGQRRMEGLYYPEIDLFIPESLVIGKPLVQKFIAPSGDYFEARFPDRDDFPIAVIDKPGLLRLLAEQAQISGVELRYGTPVLELVRENGRIVGVRTSREELRARLIISAEGFSRQFSEEAGVYENISDKKRYAFIVSQELEAPAALAEHVSQISTMGRRYTSVYPSFGTVVVPTSGRVSVYFTIYSDTPHLGLGESLWHILDEYKSDPRISYLLDGAQVLSQSGCRIVIRSTPPNVVRDGFISIGDAVGPGGHVGIIPCIYLGKQAAQIAAQALQEGNISAARLGEYNRICQGPILHGLDSEARIITSLSEMEDEQMDHLCQMLTQMNLAPFFYGEWKPIVSDTLRWFITRFPFILRDWRMIQRILKPL